jgi:hypothetical protein
LELWLAVKLREVSSVFVSSGFHCSTNKV